MIKKLFGEIPVLVTDAIPEDEIRVLSPEEFQAIDEYFEILRLFGKIKYDCQKVDDGQYLHTFTFEV